MAGVESVIISIFAKQDNEVDVESRRHFQAFSYGVSTIPPSVAQARAEQFRIRIL